MTRSASFISPPPQFVAAVFGTGDDVGPVVAVEVGDDHLVGTPPVVFQQVPSPRAAGIAVILDASVNYFGNIFNGQAPDALITAFADPLFSIDPNAFFDFGGGDVRPATEFFELSVSPGIAVIGPAIVTLPMLVTR